MTDLRLAKTPSGEPSTGRLVRSSPPSVDTGTDGVPVSSPEGAVLQWLDDMIRDVTDAAERLEALARRLREG